MRLIGNMLVWICLAIGLIAATSIYTWPLGADATSDARFELGPGGDGAPRFAELLRDVRGGDGQVVVPADAPLDPATLAIIRDVGARRVIIKHPAGKSGALLRNWSGRWYFLLAVSGLVVGAFFIRSSARKAVEQTEGVHTIAKPEDLVARLCDEVAALRASLPGLPDDEARLRAIIHQLGEVQAVLIPAFVETRPVLVAQRGVGGFARVMDLFAAAERKINRAWSAAADGVLHESVASLEEASAACEQLAQGVSAS